MSTDNLKICYIGGGSRNWTWVLMQDLAFEKEITGTIELGETKVRTGSEWNGAIRGTEKICNDFL
ncbi:hypothetical protein AGMMS4952_19600 [Spirochaetia bacterium]|nr:hypothetical protein AGMMS4952_19600 [Spirochaetia bacterium]